MLKTIKTTKQMRLDELIKYVWDNGITNTTFKSNYSAIVRINEYGDVSTTKFLHRNDSYTVEIEEPITEDTVFKCLLEIIDGELVYIRNKKTIKESVKDDTDRFYALINGKLELVYDREDKNV